MTPELGHFALILALCVAAVQGVLPLAGAARGDARWIALARPAARAQFLLVLFSFGCLAAAFVGNDFSVAYVANHSNSKLPTQFRLAATWGGHEGSLLLWLLMLAGWSAAVSVASRQLPDAMVARVLGVLGLVSAGFLLFTLFTSNPFERVLPPPADGRDLNPLLQDPGLIFHPPMLYMGYVGFSVAFAFALGALIAGRLDATWARWSRPWTIAAWIFLTLGIALGSYWAYYELGWGGWWFWDPVENASFMPWLVGTALIHSLAVTEKRGAFKSWTVLLAITAFSLSLLGTFLVRSGVLTSVHAFATDPRARRVHPRAAHSGDRRVPGALRAARAAQRDRRPVRARVARIAAAREQRAADGRAAASVLLGTLYPLVIDALGLGKLSVGPPYFNAVFVPLMVPLLFLVATGPFARWKEASARAIARRLVVPAVVAIAAGIAVPFSLGGWHPLPALGVALAAWVACATAANIRARIALSGPRQPRAWYGMHLAHLGLAVCVTGVTLVKGYESEQDVRMAPGETLTMGAYVLRFVGVREVEGPNYRASRGELTLERDGRVLKTMRPEKRAYFSSQMPMTEAAIDSGLTRDIYVSLGEPLDGGAWSVRAHHKPFVDWIWVGALLMALGGFLAASDRRYRVKVAERFGAALAGGGARG